MCILETKYEKNRKICKIKTAFVQQAIDSINVHFLLLAVQKVNSSQK